MSLDLGSVFGTVDLITTPFDVKYAAVLRKFTVLGDEAATASVGTGRLDKSMIGLGKASSDAAAGLTRADMALREASVLASRAAVSTSEADLAQSRLVQSSLRASAAQQRVADVQASAAAIARKLAAAEAQLAEIQATEGVAADKLAAAQERVTLLRDAQVRATGRAATADAALIAANDRVALSQERVAKANLLGSRTFASISDALAMVPGPAKYAAEAMALIGGASIFAATKFQDATKRIQTQAGYSAQQVHVLSQGILSMAGTVATTPNVLADAAYHIASMGRNSLTSAQQLQVLQTAAEGAKLGGANLTDVTNALDAAVASGIKGAQNYSQAMGALNATVGAGDMTMQDLADALGTRIVTSAKAAGLSLTDVGAALAVFGDLNQRGSMAATRFAQAISLMQSPTTKAVGALKSIGIGADQLGDDMRKPQGLLVALTDLKAHLEASGMSATQQAQVISAAFGGSRTSGSVMLLLQQLDRLRGKYADVDEGARTFAANWKTYTQTLSYSWGRIKAGAEAAAIAIGNDLLPEATKALGWIGTTGVGDIDRFWHSLATNPMALAGFHQVESAVGHIVSAVGNAVQALGPFEHLLLTVGGTVVLAGFAALAAVLNVVAAGIDAVTGFLAHNQVAAAALAAALATALLPAIGETVLAFGTLVAENVAAFLGSMVAGALEVATAFVAAGAGVDGFAAALEVLNINPIIAGVTVAAAAVAGLTLWLTRAHDNYDQVTAAGQQFVTALNDQHTSAAQSTADVSILVGRLRDLQAAGKGNTDQATALSAAIATQGAIASQERANVGALADEYGLSRDKVDQLASSLGINLTGNLQQASAALGRSLGPTDKLTGAENNLKNAVQGSDTAVQALSVTLDGLVGNTISADQQQNAFASGMRQLRKDLIASHGSLSRLSQAGTTARDDLDSLVNTILQSAAANEKLKDGGDKARATLQGQIDALKALGSNSPYVIGIINQLTTALNKIPATKKTQIDADARQAISHIAALRNALAGLPTSKQIHIYEETQHITGSIPLPHLAGGGPVSGPGSGTSDSVPAWLSNGEYVMPADVTASNRALLEAMRNHRPLTPYLQVAPMQAPAARVAASGGPAGAPSFTFTVVNPAPEKVSDSAPRAIRDALYVTGLSW